MSIYSLLPTMLAFIAFGAGLLLLAPRRKAIPALALGGAALLQGCTALLTVLALRDLPSRLYLLYLQVALALTALSPILFLLFSFSFVEIKDALLDRFKKFALFSASVVGIFFASFSLRPEFLKAVEAGGDRFRLLFGPVGPPFGIYLILATLSVLFQIEQVFRGTKTIQRHQLKGLIIGIAGGGLYTLFLASRLILNHSLELDLIMAGSLVYAVCWAGVTFAVVRHRLLEVEVFISRHVVYHSVVVLGVGCYLLIVGATSYLIQGLSGRWSLLLTTTVVCLGLILLAAILLSSTLQRGLKRFIHTHFYRYKYDYRLEWNEFTKKISEVRDLPTLLLKIIEMISETFWVSQVSIWLYNERSGTLSFSTSRNLPRKAQFVNRETPLVRYLLEHRTPLDVHTPRAREIAERHDDLLERFHVSLLIPLKIGRHLVGMITLGPEMKGGAYTDEDYELLKTIAQQGSNAIFSAQLIEEVSVSKETESFNKISSFLVHDLKNLVSSISLVLQNAARNIDRPEFQQDLLATLQDATDKMKGLIEKLSTLPKELQITKAPVDLNEIVTAAVESSKTGSLKGVELTTDLNTLPSVHADAEYVKKVLINLILNAVQALPEGRGRVEVSSYARDGYAHLEVVDTGVGMTPDYIQKHLFRPFTSTKKKGFGIGLFQCKAIMEAHGGSIEATSIPYRGSQFVLTFPAAPPPAETGDHSPRR